MRNKIARMKEQRREKAMCRVHKIDTIVTTSMLVNGTNVSQLDNLATYPYPPITT